MTKLFLMTAPRLLWTKPFSRYLDIPLSQPYFGFTTGIYSFFFLLLVLSATKVKGQTIILEDTFPNYDFIDFGANRIEQAAYLQPFHQKLQELESGKRQQINILHIGDSHVQADLLTGTLRRLFQQQYGNAGRGLVFFYQQAGTHAPLDYQTESSQNWESRRRIFQKNAPPIGISGMSIATTAKRFELNFSPKRIEKEAYQFNQFTLYHNDLKEAYAFQVTGNQETLNLSTPPSHPDWLSYQVKVGDKLFQISRRFACTVSDLQRWNRLPNAQIFAGQTIQVKKPRPHREAQPATLSKRNYKSSITLHTASNGFQLTGTHQGQSDTRAILYGARLEDTTAKGIQYHAAGVNGATYYHFLKGEFFLQQIADLEADLVIISLGTNEALQKRYEEKQVGSTINAFLQQLKETLPKAAVLICIPPDALISKQYPARHLPKIRQQLIQAAQAQQTAYWDLYGIMGGQGSIRQWKTQDLAYHDFIHFTQKGYILQAGLLYEALRKTYAKH